MPDVPIVQLDPDLPLPSYAHPGDAGADLVAREDATIPPGGGRVVVGGSTLLAILLAKVMAVVSPDGMNDGGYF